MATPDARFTWNSVIKQFGRFEYPHVQLVRRNFEATTHELDLTYEKRDGSIKIKKFSIRFNEKKTEITASEIWRFGILYFHRSTKKSRALKLQYDGFLSKPYRQSTFTLPTKIEIESQTIQSNSRSRSPLYTNIGTTELQPLIPASSSSNPSLPPSEYINISPSNPLYPRPNSSTMLASQPTPYDLFIGYGSLQHVIEDLDIFPNTKTLVIFQVEGVILSHDLRDSNHKFKITSAEDTANLESLKANYGDNMTIIFISEDGNYQESYIYIPFICNYKSIPDIEFSSSQEDILSQPQCSEMTAVRIIASDTNLLQNLSGACLTRKIQDTKCYQFVGDLEAQHSVLAKEKNCSSIEDLYRNYPSLKREYRTWQACPGKVYKVRH